MSVICFNFFFNQTFGTGGVYQLGTTGAGTRNIYTSIYTWGGAVQHEEDTFE